MSTNSEKTQRGEDLSDEIVRTVARLADEHVTCSRVSDQHYRCNWWTREATNAYDNPNMTGMLVTTSRISRSQFLRVTRAEGALEITDLSHDERRHRC